MGIAQAVIGRDQAMWASTIRRHSLWAGRTGAVLIIVLVASLLPDSPVAKPITAYADPGPYTRTTRNFANMVGGQTPLRTRGYFGHECLEWDVPCMTWSTPTPTYRPEATAQAKALRELNKRETSIFFGLFGSYRPGANADTSPVQWEVAGTSEPDPVPGDDSEPTWPPRWRADIVVDNFDRTFDVYEVEKWTGAASREFARTQVQGYVTAMRQTPNYLDARLGQDLNDRQWARVYTDNVGGLWCTWAGRELPGDYGVVFFARYADVDRPDLIAGCNAAYAAQLLAAYAKIVAFVVAEYVVYKLLQEFLNHLQGREGVRRPDPVPGGVKCSPYAEIVDSSASVLLTLQAAQSSLFTGHLAVEWGDEAVDQLLRTQGTGLQPSYQSHTFPPAFQFQPIIVGVSEARQLETVCVVAEDTNFIAPALLDLPNPTGCLTVGYPVAAGGIPQSGHSHALTAWGEVISWGANQNGQLGLGTSSSSVWTPQPVPRIHGLVSLAAGNFHTYALRADGSAWAVGRADLGMLGNESNWGSFLGWTLVATGDKVAELGAGSTYNSFFIMQDGSVMGTGQNNGSLGDGTTSNRWTPVRFGTVTNVVEVSSSGSHTVTTSRSGTVSGSGSNARNALGLGPPYDATYLTPQTVLTNAGLRIAAADTLFSQPVAFTIVGLPDGTAVAFGSNSAGQLGRGTVNNDPNPPDYVSGVVASVVRAGSSWGAAITYPDGRVMAQGDNRYGQLGNGTFITPNPVPGPALGVASAVDLSAASHAIALFLDGTVKTWGRGADGQLGIGSSFDQATPVIPAVSNVAQPGSCLTSPPPGQPPSAMLRLPTVQLGGVRGNTPSAPGNVVRRVTPI